MPSQGMQGPPAPSPLSACSPSAVTKISSSVSELGLKVPPFPTSSGLGSQDERGEERSQEQRSKGKHCPWLGSSPPAQDGGKQQLLWTIPCEDWPDKIVVHKFLGMKMKEPVGAHSLQHHELIDPWIPRGGRSTDFTRMDSFNPPRHLKPRQHPRNSLPVGMDGSRGICSCHTRKEKG